MTTYAFEYEGAWNRDRIPYWMQQEIYTNNDMDGNLRNEIQKFERRYECTIPQGMMLFRDDGSISFDSSELRQHFDCHEWFIGEIASPIFKNMKGLKKFFIDFYPDYANDSCGIHGHFKPSLGDYTNAVMNYTKFKDDYLKFLTYYGKYRGIKNTRYWYRVEGNEVS